MAEPAVLSRVVEPRPRYEAQVRALILILGAVLAVIYVAEIRNRYLVNDDYQLLYTAWLESVGKVPGRDFAIYSYHLLVDLLVPLFRWFPDSFVPLYAGRAFMVLVLAGVGWLLYSLTLRLCGRTAALFAPLLGLSSRAMIARAVDLRPDLITTLLWLGVLRLMADDKATRPWRVLLVGALIGVGVVNRFKAALIVPFVALVLADRIGRRDGWAKPHTWKRVAAAAGLVTIGACIPLALYAAFLWAHGELHNFLVVNTQLVEVVGAAERTGGTTLEHTLGQSLLLDTHIWVLAAIGLLLRGTDRARYRRSENVATVAVAGLAAASVALNPAYYPYNLVTLVPLLAPFAAYPLGRVIDARRSAASPAILAGAFLLFPFVRGAPRMLSEVTRRSDAHQLALARFLTTYTPRNAATFALEGVGLFRPSIFHWHMPAVLLPSYYRGDIDLTRELAAAAPEVVILSYRVPRWLTPRDRQYIAEHYVPIAPLVLVQGFASDGAAALAPAAAKSHGVGFDLLSSGRYEVSAGGAGGCAIDNHPVVKGGVLDLSSGPHTMDAAVGGCTIRRYYPRAARALIANRGHHQYLVAPGLAPPP